MKTNDLERVEKLFKIIRDANLELVQIRKKCKHTDYEVGYFSWRVGLVQILKICSNCKETMGEPTEKELKKFKDEGKDTLGILDNDKIVRI